MKTAGIYTRVFTRVYHNSGMRTMQETTCSMHTATMATQAAVCNGSLMSVRLRPQTTSHDLC